VHTFFQIAKKDCQIQFKRLQFQPIGDSPIFNCRICINNFINTEVEKLKAVWSVSPPWIGLCAYVFKSISNGAQYVTPDSKIYCIKVKMCRFSSGNWFSCTKPWSLPWLVKGATQLCTSKKECNKLDLTAAEYFCLVNRNDWSRWFAITSPHIYTVPVTVLLVGLLKNHS